MEDKFVLVACEESQRVCAEFRKLGFVAFSCDIEQESGGHPEWHIQQDVIPLLKGSCIFETNDGTIHILNRKWDLIIAHPPCTYLSITGNRWFNGERYREAASERFKKRITSAEFFMTFVHANCDHIAIENPIGVMSTWYRKPDQIVHPYWFGDPERKSTCLWLMGLPPLKPTKMVEPVIIKYKNGQGTDSPWHMNTMNLPPHERSRLRSQTFPGLARAMAAQWSEALKEENDV